MAGFSSQQDPPSHYNAETGEHDLRKRALLLLLVLLFLPALAPPVKVHASTPIPIYTLMLDAHSTSQTDVDPTSGPDQVESTFTTGTSFRVGVIINATSTNPLANVYGWQFQISYNPNILVPQADPAPSPAYPDGADSTVKYGSQTTPSVNWNGYLAANQAFAFTSTRTPGEIVVGYTLVAPTPAVTISAKNMLANVAFEIRSKATSQTSITLNSILFLDKDAHRLPEAIMPQPIAPGQTLASDPKIKFVNATTDPLETWSPSQPVVYDANNNDAYDRASNEPLVNGTVSVFSPILEDPKLTFLDTNGNGVWDSGEPVVYDADQSGSYDSGEPVVSGSQALETITNNPPHALFTATPLPGGDPACTPVTGSPCSPYALTFDATASTDVDGTIANPTGYYWDFGDGTQDGPEAVSTCPILQCNQGSVAVHDYGVPGSFDATLRVVDNGTATGSARDSLGNTILNSQPSHTNLRVVADVPPTATFTFTPNSPHNGQPVFFDGAPSSDPDGTITSFTWAFNDTRTGAGSSIFHTFTAPGTYHVKLTVTDDLGTTASQIQDVIVIADLPPLITVSGPSHAPPNTSLTLSLASSDPDGTVASVTIDWGDGFIDSLPGNTTSAFHNYIYIGTYIVILTATDDGGQTATTNKTLTIDNRSPPVLTISGPTTATTGTNITLSFSGSASTGATLVSMSIDWGDGTLENISISSTFASHRYSLAGTYNVTLTATDSNGLTTEKSQIIIVTSPSETPLLTTLAIITAIGVLAVALAFLSLRRRKTRSPLTTLQRWASGPTRNVSDPYLSLAL